MDAIEKLKMLAPQMRLEPAEELRGVGRRPKALSPDYALASAIPSCGVEPGPVKQDSLGIHYAVTPGGRPMRMLKTLLTSACERDCYYCPFRAGRNFRRATFTPEEMARTFMQMQRAGKVDGMFLSSGVVRGGAATQDKLIDATDILRNRLGFRGYVHLKIMPGAGRDQVERAMQLADRVSVNLEAPNMERLRQLAPRKQFHDELLQPLKWAEEMRRAQSAHRAWNGRWPSTVTQFVVGGVGESDLEHLTMASYLYRQLRLARTYFSAFRPVPDTPLENLPAEEPLREHRLYQASFLLRDYEFDLEELPFVDGGNLPRGVDPKLAWAEQHLTHAPVDINRAPRRELLRVPGIGPGSARLILAARRESKLSDLSHLQALGVRTTRLAPFVLLDGRRPAQQMRLF